MELNKRKVVSFGLLTDFDIVFSHVDGFKLPGTDFATLKISGFNDSISFLKNLHNESDYCEKVSTYVAFRLDFSGLVTVDRAFVKCKSKTATVADPFKESYKDYERMLFEEYNYVEYYDSFESSDDQIEDDNITRSLNSEILYTNLNPQDKEYKTASRNILLDLKEIDKKRDARDKARNILEAYIYNVQELLEIDEFIAVSTEEQRKELLDVVTSVSEWLEKNGDVSTLDELNKRKNNIEILEVPISERRIEARERSFRVEELRRRIHSFIHFLNGLPIEKTQDSLNTSVDETKIAYEKILSEAGYGSGARKNMRDVIEPGFRYEDVEAYRKDVIKVEEWLNKSITAQDALKPWENPVLKVKDIMVKIWELEQTKENVRIMERVYLKSRDFLEKEKMKAKESVNESDPSVFAQQNATVESPINTTLAEPAIHSDL